MSDPRQERPGTRVPRRITPLLRDAAPLLMLASALFYSNRWFALIDDEASAVGAAAHGAGAILAASRSAAGNAQPFIYEMLLHFWLRITGGAFEGLRAPAIAFFVIGLWLLSRVAGRFGGEESSNALIWLGALWPFGFHAGRLAAPYTFAFFLVAAVTWQYFRFLASRRRSDAIIFCVLALALIYTNDFGWALLFLLGLDYWLRDSEASRRVQTILTTAVVLAIGFVPRLPVFARELRSHLGWPQSFRFLGIDAAYNFYVLFVSQAVAPWFWRFSIPAAVAVIVLLAFVFAGTRREERRFLIFFAILFVLMALTQTMHSSSLLLIAPWLLLPMAVALGTIEKSQWRIPMAVSLAMVALVGWYGTLNRRYYAEPSFFVPWSSVAHDAAQAAQGGMAVIGNNGSFFLYLTYELKPAQSNSGWRFTGALPEDVQYPLVWDPKQWEEAGRPEPPGVLWIRDTSSSADTAMNDAGESFNQHCGDRISRYLARDLGYTWKQRFVPGFSGSPWRVEIRQYLCGEASKSPSSGSPTQAPR
jgi:hypothetical protein